MRRQRHEASDLLRGVPLFADSSEDELAAIAELGEEVTLDEGRYLVQEGHRGASFTLVLEGTADVNIGDEHVRSLGPGDFVGEIAMVLGGRSTATVVATSPVRAMCLSNAGFQQVLSRSPGLRAKVEHQAWERMHGPSSHDQSP